MAAHCRSDRLILSVLHPCFLLTGVLHAIGGALLPSLAAAFHLSDSQSGSLFFSYYAGTSVGALLCVGRYVRLIVVGFAAIVAVCLSIAVSRGIALQPLFFALGIGVGIPMTAINMFAGRRFADRAAAPITFLNFSWSAGALIAPLLAARILLGHTYRAAYLVLAVAAAAAALVCALVLQEPAEPPVSEQNTGGSRRIPLIAIFALLAFLQVGVENIAATWLATYSLRNSTAGVAIAAASTSFYWSGFLASRGVSSLLLLRVAPERLLRTVVIVALIAAGALLGLSSAAAHDAAMLVLGTALAPVFPLLLAQLFARVQNTSDARWVLALCGFGGSVLPWITGLISARTHSLKLGLALVPAALLLMLLFLPTLVRPADS